MRLTPVVTAVVALVLLPGGITPEAQTRGQQFGQIQPPRDTPAETADGAGADESLATISGRVVAADSGQPLKRARVTARREGSRDRVAANTDDSGRFAFSELTEGRYTLSVSKPGFVTLSYGQRRPRQPATPVQVTVGQHLRNVNFNLPRGSVITGQVIDEDGAPLPLATVRLLRYVYRQGQQQLVPAGTDRSDDRGQYRTFGLEPGDYYVSATVPRQLLTPGGASFLPGGRGGAALGGRFPDLFEPAQVENESDLGYAPTYYPGVTSLAQAVRVSVGLSAELAGVDFGVQLVPTAVVSGTAFGPDGTSPFGSQVMLMPSDGAVFPGSMLGTRVDGDGRFEIRDVPPGQYTVRALTRGGRGGRGGPQSGGGIPMCASQALAIDGYDVSDLTLILGPGATVSGSVSFEAMGQAEPDDMTRIRVTATALDPVPMTRSTNARVGSDGTFRLENVADGARIVRASGVPTGWTLKAVYVGGRDVIDTPLDFGGAGHVEGLRLLFTDQVSELSGVVHDERRQPLTDFTVIAFPANDTVLATAVPLHPGVAARPER